MDKYDIFISYRTKGGKSTALLLYHFLKAEGYLAFIDTEFIYGGDKQEKLFGIIEQCRDFVVILDEHVFDDGDCWVKSELQKAIEKDKHIIPVTLMGYERKEINNEIEKIHQIFSLSAEEANFIPKFKESLWSKPKKQIVLGHQSLHVPTFIEKAKQHILLHAAFYPKYAGQTEYNHSLEQALKNNPELPIKVIFTKTKDNPWADEFAHVLRMHYATKENFENDMKGNIDYFKNLACNYKNVEIKFSSALPFCPYIIIDDTIFVGHYAHAEKGQAPDGFWLKICDPILYNNSDNSNDNLTELERAIYRYIEDFNYAWLMGTNI